MALSSSKDFTMTAQEVVNAAYRKLNVIGDNETADTSLMKNGREAMNLMLKAWGGQRVGMWLRRLAYLPLTVDQYKYKLGKTAGYNHFMSDIHVAEVSSVDTSTRTYVVTDDPSQANGWNIAAADNIGVRINTDDLFWTTIESISTTSIVLPSGDNPTTYGHTWNTDGSVYLYKTTARMARPVDVISASLYDTINDNFVDLPKLSRDEYLALNTRGGQFKHYDRSKAYLNLSSDYGIESPGTPTMFYYDAQIDQGLFTVWPTPDKSDWIVELNCLVYPDDIDANTNNIEIPPEWYEATVYNLALRLSHGYKSVPGIAEFAQYTYANAVRASRPAERLKIQPNLRSYYEY